MVTSIPSPQSPIHARAVALIREYSNRALISSSQGVLTPDFVRTQKEFRSLPFDVQLTSVQETILDLDKGLTETGFSGFERTALLMDQTMDAAKAAWILWLLDLRMDPNISARTVAHFAESGWKIDLNTRFSMLNRNCYPFASHEMNNTTMGVSGFFELLDMYLADLIAVTSAAGSLSGPFNRLSSSVAELVKIRAAFLGKYTLDMFALPSEQVPDPDIPFPVFCNLLRSEAIRLIDSVRSFKQALEENIVPSMRKDIDESVESIINNSFSLLNFAEDYLEFEPEEFLVLCKNVRGAVDFFASRLDQRSTLDSICVRQLSRLEASGGFHGSKLWASFLEEVLTAERLSALGIQGADTKNPAIKLFRRAKEIAALQK